MILDCKANPSDARKYDIIDKYTGENIGKAYSIFYADESTGLVLYYLENKGVFVFGDHGHPVIREEYMNIKIVPKKDWSP